MKYETSFHFLTIKAANGTYLKMHSYIADIEPVLQRYISL